MRVEAFKKTCAGPKPGTVIETEVAGFEAGSGKTGVRGPVMSREGALVKMKAFASARMNKGVGQGVSHGVPDVGGRARQRRGGRQRPAHGDMGRAGFGAGASSAGQKVADYRIRRAESVPAGDRAPDRHEGDAGAPRGSGADQCAPSDLAWRGRRG